MRLARAPRFSGLLEAFTSEIVLPSLSALATGTASSTDNLAVRRLMGLKQGEGANTILSQLDQDLWMATGNAVIREYNQWQGWLAVSPLSVPLPAARALAPNVKYFFNDCLYGVGFGDGELWTLACGEPYSKQDLCNLFVEELGHSSCPYCDLDTILGTYSLEHFVPKSRAPYLAASARNLYVACNACNSPQLGKGSTIRYPISLPRDEELGEQIDFIVSDAGLQLQAPSNPVYASRVGLLKLEARYGQANVFRDASRRALLVYESVLRGRQDVQLDEFDDYHRAFYRTERLYYASRAVLRDVCNRNQ